MNDNELITYYTALKRLWKLHVDFGYGKNPPIPSGFSERLCKRLCGLEERKRVEFDASSNGKHIEIKATGDAKGTTTINLDTIYDAGNEFGGIKWIYFDFEQDQVHIVHIPPRALEQRLTKLAEKRRKQKKKQKAARPRKPTRKSITLRNLISDGHEVYVISVKTSAIVNL